MQNMQNSIKRNIGKEKVEKKKFECAFKNGKTKKKF